MCHTHTRTFSPPSSPLSSSIPRPTPFPLNLRLPQGSHVPFYLPFSQPSPAASCLCLPPLTCTFQSVPNTSRRQLLVCPCHLPHAASSLSLPPLLCIFLSIFVTSPLQLLSVSNASHLQLPDCLCHLSPAASCLPLPPLTCRFLSFSATSHLQIPVFLCHLAPAASCLFLPPLTCSFLSVSANSARMPEEENLLKLSEDRNGTKKRSARRGSDTRTIQEEEGMEGEEEDPKSGSLPFCIERINGQFRHPTSRSDRFSAGSTNPSPSQYHVTPCHSMSTHPIKPHLIHSHHFSIVLGHVEDLMHGDEGTSSVTA